MRCQGALCGCGSSRNGAAAAGDAAAGQGFRLSGLDAHGPLLKSNLESGCDEED